MEERGESIASWGLCLDEQSKSDFPFPLNLQLRPDPVAPSPRMMVLGDCYSSLLLCHNSSATSTLFSICPTCAFKTPMGSPLSKSMHPLIYVTSERTHPLMTCWHASCMIMSSHTGCAMTCHWPSHSAPLTVPGTSDSQGGKKAQSIAGRIMYPVVLGSSKGTVLNSSKVCLVRDGLYRYFSFCKKQRICEAWNEFRSTGHLMRVSTVS